MNTLSRTITGTLAIILGLILIGFSFSTTYWMLVYGVVFIVVGIFIFLNKKEDEIEKIRTKSKGGKNKMGGGLK